MTKRLLPVLMTASVDTRGMKDAAFSPQEREAMYGETLSRYLRTICEEMGAKIVFAENSGWDLTHLRARVPPMLVSQVEFLSLDPADFDIARGKGFNEARLLAEAASRSSFVREAGGFFKVTGRYPIYNLARFVQAASKAIFEDDRAWYCDIKDHPLYDMLRLGWHGHYFDARLFGVSSDYYLKEIYPRTVTCNDYEGRSLELALFDAVKAAKAGEVVDRFRFEPHIGGVAGVPRENLSWPWNQGYDSPLERVKRFVGNLNRLFFPWFKF